MNRAGPSELEIIRNEKRLTHKIRSNASRNNAVLKFLKDHPGSTAGQVFEATGFGIGNVPFLRAKKIDGKFHYFYDDIKAAKYLSNE